MAVRLPNGHTLVSGKGETPVVEYDQQGQVVWSLAQDDVPFHINMNCGVQRLPNGNTVVGTCWHGKETDKTAPMAFEVTRSKEVVWKAYSPNEYMGNIQIMDVSGDVYAGEFLK